MEAVSEETYPGLTEEQRVHFEEHGYIIVKNAAEPIGIERIRNAYERTERETKQNWLDMLESGNLKGGYGNGPNAPTISPNYEWDTTILDLANNPKVIPIIKELVGPDYQVMEMLYHNHHAGTIAHTKWHRDWPPWAPRSECSTARPTYPS